MQKQLGEAPFEMQLGNGHLKPGLILGFIGGRERKEEEMQGQSLSLGHLKSLGQGPSGCKGVTEAQRPWETSWALPNSNPHSHPDR